MAGPSGSVKKKCKSPKNDVDKYLLMKTKQIAGGKKNIPKLPPLKRDHSGTPISPNAVKTDELNEIKNINCSFCRPFSSIQATPEMIMVFQHVTNHLRLRIENQAGGSNSGLHQEVDASGSGVNIPEWKIPTAGKVELMPGSGVWLNSGQLSIMTSSLRGDPNELRRNLLRWIVTDKELPVSCALGNSEDKKELDPVMYQAVRAYVTKETGVHDVPFHRIVNQKCQQLARKYGIPRKPKGSAKRAAGRRSRSNKSLKRSKSTVSSSDRSIDSTVALGIGDSDAAPEEKALHRKSSPQKYEKFKKKRRGKEEEEDSDSALDEFSKWTARELDKRGIDLNSSSSLPMGLSTSCQSGHVDIDLIDNEFAVNECKTSTPTKQQVKAAALDNSSQYLLGRRSSSSFSNSLDWMNAQQSNKLVRPKNKSRLRGNGKGKSSTYVPTLTDALRPKNMNLNSSLSITPSGLIAAGQSTETFSVEAQCEITSGSSNKENATYMNSTPTVPMHETTQVNPHNRPMSYAGSVPTTSHQHCHIETIPPSSQVEATSVNSQNFPVTHVNPAAVIPHQQQYFGGSHQQQPWPYPHNFAYPHQSQSYSPYVDQNSNVNPYNNYQSDWYGNPQFNNNEFSNNGPSNKNVPYQKF